MSMKTAQQGGAIGGAIGEYAGAVIGELIAAGEMEKAKDMAWTISRKYADMPLPKILKMFPELQGDTALAGNRADERYTSVEDEALRKMMDLSSGKLTAEDEANMMRARIEGQQQSQAQMGSIDREARRRGASTGGGASAAKQLAAQQSANRAYQGGMQAQGDASQRALQALQMGGAYASNLANRDLNQKNIVGGARDRISEFNLGRKDKTQLYNNEIGQRNFENKASLLAGETEGLKLLMDQYNAQGQSYRRTSRAGGGAIGTAIGTGAGA